MIYNNLDRNDPLFNVKHKVNQDYAFSVSAIKQEWEDNPNKLETFVSAIKARNWDGLVFGSEQGWWEIDDNGQMVGPAIKFKLSEFPENALMAHVVAKLGIFPSVGQARKNGHDKPIELGLHIFTKKKIRVVVEE